MLYLKICNLRKQTNVLEKWLSHQIYTIGDGAMFLLSYSVAQEDNALRIKGNLQYLGMKFFMAGHPLAVPSSKTKMQPPILYVFTQLPSIGDSMAQVTKLQLVQLTHWSCWPPSQTGQSSVVT
jgi:hypothetical protein